MGPQILNLDQISRYIDGELSAVEMREVEFQAESWGPSQQRLNDHRHASDCMKQLFREIKSDPAYGEFVAMVESWPILSDDTVADCSLLNTQLIKRLFPNSQALQDLLKQITDDLTRAFPFPDSEGPISLSDMMSPSSNSENMNMKLDINMDSPASRPELGYSASERVPPVYKVPGQPIASFEERLRNLIKKVHELEDIAILFEELNPGITIHSRYPELVLILVEHESLLKNHSESAVEQRVKDCLRTMSRVGHPLARVLIQLFRGKPVTGSLHRDLLKTYMQLVRDSRG